MLLLLLFSLSVAFALVLYHHHSMLHTMKEKLTRNVLLRSQRDQLRRQEVAVGRLGERQQLGRDLGERARPGIWAGVLGRGLQDARRRVRHRELCDASLDLFCFVVLCCVFRNRKRVKKRRGRRVRGDGEERERRKKRSLPSRKKKKKAVSTSYLGEHVLGELGLLRRRDVVASHPFPRVGDVLCCYERQRGRNRE